MSPGRVSAVLSVALHALLWVTLERLSKPLPTDPFDEEVARVRVTLRQSTPDPREPRKSSRATRERRGRVGVGRRGTPEVADRRQAPSAGEGEGSTGAGGQTGPRGRPDGLDLSVKPSLPPPTWLVPRPPPPSPEIDYELRPQAGGGYIVKDRQVWAEIRRDGQITFHDVPPVQMRFPRSGNRRSPTALARLKDETDAPLSVSFSVDLNDVILRTIGDDPYGGIKRDILKKTQELREQLYEEACQEDLRESIVALNDRLRRIWSKTRISSEARRRKLFALWDECLEQGDDVRARHGRIARETIIAFIQRHLPADGSDAFGPEEIVALNRHRRSRSRFEPYGAL